MATRALEQARTCCRLPGNASLQNTPSLPRVRPQYKPRSAARTYPPPQTTEWRKGQEAPFMPDPGVARLNGARDRG